MKISRTTLAKIYLSLHPTWFSNSPTKLFESDDGVVLFDSAGFLYIFFATGMGKEDSPLEKIDDFHPNKPRHAHYLVMPYDMISPSIIERLKRLENRMDENDEGARICIVADVGKDSSIGKTKYSFRGFDSIDQLTDLIKNELTHLGAKIQPDLNNVPDSKMRIAVKHIIMESGNKGVSLNQVNEIINSIGKS